MDINSLVSARSHVMIPHHPRSTPFPYTTLFLSEGPKDEQPDQPIPLDKLWPPNTPERARAQQVLKDFVAKQQAGYELSPAREDRKSTRLNSSHLVISYAVFCLKKKK